MIEDINTIQELIAGAKAYGEYEGNKYYKSMENLIARYKELEKKLDYMQPYITYVERRIERILEDNDYIPKLKVKEKIEELEKEIEEKQERGTDFTLIHEHEIDTNGIIQVLQELLED